MAYKQQKVIAQNSRSWKSKIRLPAWLVSGESPLLGCRLLTSPYILTWQQRQGVSLRPLYEGTNSMYEGSTLITYSPTKGLDPNVTTLRISNSTYELWDRNIETIADVFFKARSQSD